MSALFAVLLCFASPFSQCYFLLPNRWNNLIKTTKKPDVSFVETSSVPISQGEGLINTKCLFFKTFHSFAFNFHFKICQSSSKIVTFQHHNVPIKARTHQIHSVTKLLIPTFSSKTFFSPCNFIASGCPATV